MDRTQFPDSADIIIRKATEKDIPACAQVLAPVFADKVEAIVGDMEKALEIIPMVIELMRGETWVAELPDSKDDAEDRNTGPGEPGITRIVGAIIVTLEEPRFLLGSLWTCLRVMGLRVTMRAFSIIRNYLKSAPDRLEKEAVLEAVGVIDRCGGKGIGAALVSTAGAFLVERQLRFFGLGVKRDSPAVRFYERLGFGPQGEYSNRLGNWLYMRKELE